MPRRKANRIATPLSSILRVIYKGAFFFSFIGGRSIAPSGSFIRHEKDYDKTLALQIRNGDYINPLSAATSNTNLPSSFDAEYTPGYSWQIELEYGTFSYFGFGFTVSQFSIEAKRQDVFLSGASPALVTPTFEHDALQRHVCNGYGGLPSHSKIRL